MRIGCVGVKVGIVGETRPTEFRARGRREEGVQGNGISPADTGIGPQLDLQVDYIHQQRGGGVAAVFAHIYGVGGGLRGQNLGLGFVCAQGGIGRFACPEIGSRGIGSQVQREKLAEAGRPRIEVEYKLGDLDLSRGRHGAGRSFRLDGNHGVWICRSHHTYGIALSAARVFGPDQGAFSVVSDIEFHRLTPAYLGGGRINFRQVGGQNGKCDLIEILAAPVEQKALIGDHALSLGRENSIPGCIRRLKADGRPPLDFEIGKIGRLVGRIGEQGNGFALAVFVLHRIGHDLAEGERIHEHFQGLRHRTTVDGIGGKIRGGDLGSGGNAGHSRIGQAAVGSAPQERIEAVVGVQNRTQSDRFTEAKLIVFIAFNIDGYIGRNDRNGYLGGISGKAVAAHGDQLIYRGSFRTGYGGSTIRVIEAVGRRPAVFGIVGLGIQGGELDRTVLADGGIVYEGGKYEQRIGFRGRRIRSWMVSRCRKGGNQPAAQHQQPGDERPEVANAFHHIGNLRRVHMDHGQIALRLLRHECSHFPQTVPGQSRPISIFCRVATKLNRATVKQGIFRADFLPTRGKRNPAHCPMPD